MAPFIVGCGVWVVGRGLREVVDAEEDADVGTKRLGDWGIGDWVIWTAAGADRRGSAAVMGAWGPGPLGGGWGGCEDRSGGPSVRGSVQGRCLQAESVEVAAGWAIVRDGEYAAP